MIDRKYDAFISYRHSELDMYIAKTIEKKLETFKLPKALHEKASRTKIERVFRDQDELPIASNLSEQITAALEVADFLIVICTPRLPESKWCLSEITNFKRMHGKEHILAVLAEGEPDDSFPEELVIDEIETTNEKGEKVVETVRIEPLAADVRGASKKEINKKIDDAVMRLAAAIYGVNYDDLKQRHKEREMKAKMAKMTIAASVFMAFAVVSTIFMINLAGKNNEIMTQNAMIIKQNEEIEQKNETLESQKKEIEEKIVKIQKDYIATMANTAEDLIKRGRKKEAIYALLSVIPDSADDEMYSAECHRILNECIGFNLPNDDYALMGSVDIDSELDKANISTNGSYAVVSDRSGYLWVIDVEKAEIIDKIDYADYSEFAFVDDTHFVYTDDENGYLGRKGNMYSVEDKSITDMGIGEIKGKSISNYGDRYLIYSNYTIEVFNDGEYVPDKIYTRRVSEKEDTGTGAVYECRFINESEIMIYSGYSGSGSKLNICIYDIDNEELKIDKDIATGDTEILIKCLYFGNEYYVITSDKILSKDEGINYQKPFDLNIYVMDEKGKVVRKNHLDQIPTNEIGFLPNIGITFVNQECVKVIDKDSLKEIKDYGFTFDEYENLVSARLTINASQIFLTYNNGRCEAYSIGDIQQDEYDFITKKFNKEINKSFVANGVFVQTLKGESNVIISKEKTYERASLNQVNYGASISNNGKYTLLKVSTIDGSVVKLIENEQGTSLKNIPVTRVYGFGFVNEGDSFYILSEKIEVYSSDTQELLYEMDPMTYKNPDGTSEPIISYVVPGEILNTIAFRITDKYETFYIYSLEDGSVKNDVTFDEEITDIFNSKFVLSPTGEYYGMYYDTNELYLYRTGEDSPIAIIPIRYKLLDAMTISSDNKYLAIGYTDDKIEIYNIQDINQKKTIYSGTYYMSSFGYIESMDKYLLMDIDKGYLLNKDLEVEEEVALAVGYGKDKGYLINNYFGVSFSPYPSYEELVKSAKEYLGDYTPSEEIMTKYHIGEVDN